MGDFQVHLGRVVKTGKHIYPASIVNTIKAKVRRVEEQVVWNGTQPAVAKTLTRKPKDDSVVDGWQNE